MTPGSMSGNRSLKSLKNWLQLSQTKDLDLESLEALQIHRSLILGKPFLRKLYERYYAIFLKEGRALPRRGLLVELGSGSGFLKQVWPDVTTSDLRPSPFVDAVFSAYEMPFADESVRGLFGLNTFHHLDRCEQFLTEAQRILAPGARMVFIEPTHNRWAQFVYQHLSQEPFDPDAPDWSFASMGPLSSSNQALAWNVFIRDREKFLTKFPRLGIAGIHHHTAMAYLLSGGLSYPSLLPGWLFEPAWCADRLAVALCRSSATMMTVVIEKRK